MALRQVETIEIARCIYSVGGRKACDEPASFWPVIYLRCEDGEDVHQLLLLPHCAMHQAIAHTRLDPLRAANFPAIAEECRAKGHGNIVEESIQLGWTDRPYLACTICGRRDGQHPVWCKGEKHAQPIHG